MNPILRAGLTLAILATISSACADNVAPLAPDSAPAQLADAGAFYEAAGNLIEAIERARCERQAECGMLSGTVEACVDGAVADLCTIGGIDCHASLASYGVSQRDAARCIDDTRHQDCDAAKSPASCTIIGF
jgi:hypothetical protein